MGACCEGRAHLLLVVLVHAGSIQQPGRPARRCTRCLQREVLQLTWLVGVGIKAAVCDTLSKTGPWGALSTMAQTGVATLVVDDGESF